jgi:hypothetical protein
MLKTYCHAEVLEFFDELRISIRNGNIGREKAVRFKKELDFAIENKALSIRQYGELT